MIFCWTKEFEKHGKLDKRNWLLENKHETNIEYFKREKVGSRNWVHEMARLNGITAVHINIIILFKYFYFDFLITNA